MPVFSPSLPEAIWRHGYYDNRVDVDIYSGETKVPVQNALESNTAFTVWLFPFGEVEIMNPKQKVAAGFLVFRRLGKEIQYLLLQTSYGEHHWTPPKGHVDPGETELQTALRETEEEAGLKESDFTMYTEFQRTLNYEVRGKPKRVVYWLSELKNPNTPLKLSDEHIDFKWLNLPQALNFVEKYKDFQQVLNDADSYIKSNL